VGQKCQCDPKFWVYWIQINLLVVAFFFGFNFDRDALCDDQPEVNCMNRMGVAIERSDDLGCRPTITVRAWQNNRITQVFPSAELPDVNQVCSNALIFAAGTMSDRTQTLSAERPGLALLSHHCPQSDEVFRPGVFGQY
jgi:hypothetical protein